MNFDKYMHPCNHFHNEATEHFRHPKKFFHAPLQSTSGSRNHLFAFCHCRLFFIIFVVVQYMYIYNIKSTIL